MTQIAERAGAVPLDKHGQPVPGVYENVPFDEYRGLEAMNVSTLKKGERSMAHLHHAETEEPDEPTPSMRLGTAFHTLTLQPETFAGTMVVKPEFRGKGSKAEREAWEADHDGQCIISADQYDAAVMMSSAVKAHPEAGAIIRAKGLTEVVIVWIDEGTGLLCKMRADRIVPGVALIDLKSAADASPDVFSKAIYDFDYHWQAWWYRQGVSHHPKVFGEMAELEFIFCVVENAAPWCVADYRIDDESLKIGGYYCQSILKEYARCKASGVWPGYPTVIQTNGLPLWAIKRFEDSVGGVA